MNSYNTNEKSNITFEKYVSNNPVPPDILYEDSNYFRKNKKSFSLQNTGRNVKPISNSSVSD